MILLFSATIFQMFFLVSRTYFRQLSLHVIILNIYLYLESNRHSFAHFCGIFSEMVSPVHYLLCLLSTLKNVYNCMCTVTQLHSTSALRNYIRSCTYTYTRIYMYICEYICICIGIHTYKYTVYIYTAPILHVLNSFARTRIYIHIPTYMYTYICICKYIHTHTHIHVLYTTAPIPRVLNAIARMCANIHTQTNIHTCIHICIRSHNYLYVYI